MSDVFAPKLYITVFYLFLLVHVAYLSFTDHFWVE